MVVLLAALAVGLVVRAVRRLPVADLELRRSWLVGAAVAAQAAGALLPLTGAYAVGLVLSGLLAAGFLVLNRGVRGLGLVALGFASNALAVLVNGGRMPVDPGVAGGAGVDPLRLLGDGRHRLATSATPLRPLVDVIGLPAGPLSAVLSVGDVLVGAGLLLVVAAGRSPLRVPRTLRSPEAVLPDGAADPRRLDGNDDEQVVRVRG